MDNRSWPEKKKKLVNAQKDLQKKISTAEDEDFTLKSEISRLQRQCNNIFKVAENRTVRQLTGAEKYTDEELEKLAKTITVQYTNDERQRMQQFVNSIARLKQEQGIKFISLEKHRKAMNSVCTTLTQQDTIHAVSNTYNMLDKVGIDMDAIDRKMDKAENTEARINMISASIDDRMNAVHQNSDSGNNSKIYEDLFTRGMPFPESSLYKVEPDLPVMMRQYEDMQDVPSRIAMLANQPNATVENDEDGQEMVV